MTQSAPFFTVLTPTYNRAHTLNRVYRSLLAQTCGDFEWLIVDDGSTDETSTLIRRWVDEGKLVIRYFSQRNGGKHVAFNRGVREARGHMVVPLDSDDECVPEALERFRYHWQAIPDLERQRFASIMCLCRDEMGGVLSNRLPCEVVDGRPFEVTSRLRLSGEMWIALRIEVLRAHPFPEFPGERFVPEGLVWNRIGRHYITRFINEPLRTYFDSLDSLSRSSVRMRAGSPRGTLLYYRELMDLDVRCALRLRAATNLWRFALVSGRIRDAVACVVRHPFPMALCTLPGFLLAVRDRWALLSLRLAATRVRRRG